MTNLALSSYWMRGRWERVSDFFRAGVDFGFRSFEVSGLRCDTFYDEIHPGQFNIVSFHSPAPSRRGTTAMGSQEARRADIALTSLDDERRQQAVAVVKRCLDVASEYGAQAIVLHLGNTSADPELSSYLKQVCLDVQSASPQAHALRSRILAERALGRAERMAALRRSLDELVPHASLRGVRLGLENRPIDEIPSFEDMGEILAWCSDDAIGYWHDTGHAQVLQALGFAPHADWLRAYGHRLIGAHLHDEARLEVHLAPGEGNVNWTGLVALMPANALRVIETNHAVSEKSLRAGVEHLRATGWIGK